MSVASISKIFESEKAFYELPTRTKIGVEKRGDRTIELSRSIERRKATKGLGQVEEVVGQVEEERRKATNEVGRLEEEVGRVEEKVHEAWNKRLVLAIFAPGIGISIIFIFFGLLYNSWLICLGGCCLLFATCDMSLQIPGLLRLKRKKGGKGEHE